MPNELFRLQLEKQFGSKARSSSQSVIPSSNRNILHDGNLVLDESVFLSPATRVLDSGTGTGAWLLTLASRLPPTADLVGSDISNTLFPHHHPPNVHFVHTSSTSLPPTWISRFDFVNQRFLGADLTVHHWHVVLTQLLKVMKPGSSIQLMEFGGIKSSGLVSNSLVAIPRSDQIIETVKRRRQLLINIGEALPDMMAQTGFANIQCNLRRLPVGALWGEPGVKGARSAEGMVRMFGQALLDEGQTQLCASSAELDALITRARQEWDHTPGVFCDIYVITAKRAA